MLRWGGAFKKIKGLSGVLWKVSTEPQIAYQASFSGPTKKGDMSSSALCSANLQARGLHLSHAEQPVTVDASEDDLRARAVLKQTRTLLCLAIEGFQVL